jgi:monovalent cation/hydrogen antiporter
LDDLANETWVPRQGANRLRATYTQRIRRASPINPGDDDAAAQAQASLRRLRHETLTAERRAVIALRDQGVISDDVLQRLEQELDVEAMRIGLGETRMDGDR